MSIVDHCYKMAILFENQCWRWAISFNSRWLLSWRLRDSVPSPFLFIHSIANREYPIYRWSQMHIKKMVYLPEKGSLKDKHATMTGPSCDGAIQLAVTVQRAGRPGIPGRFKPVICRGHRRQRRPLDTHYGRPMPSASHSWRARCLRANIWIFRPSFDIMVQWRIYV